MTLDILKNARREDDVNGVTIDLPTVTGSGSDGKHSFTLPIVTAAGDRRSEAASPKTTTTKVDGVTIDLPTVTGSGSDGKHSFTLPIVTAVGERRSQQAAPTASAPGSSVDGVTIDLPTVTIGGSGPLKSGGGAADLPGEVVIGSQTFTLPTVTARSPTSASALSSSTVDGVTIDLPTVTAQGSGLPLVTGLVPEPDSTVPKELVLDQPQPIAAPSSTSTPSTALKLSLPTAAAAASLATSAIAERFISIGGDGSDDGTTDGHETFNNWDHLNHTQKIIVIVCTVVAGIILLLLVGLCVVCCGRRRRRSTSNSSRYEHEQAAHHQREVGGPVGDEPRWNEGKTPAYYQPSPPQQQLQVHGGGYQGSSSAHGGAPDPFSDPYAAPKQ
ncbi:hypothetical protein OC844_004193 [Tilletia horrida]|nr:hypothetical protein OC844_004193 [Tilletia horrida]